MNVDRCRRAAFTLLVVLLCLPVGADAEPAAFAHVTVDATILCKDIDVATARIALSLDDAIVSGRKYYPEVTVDHLGANRLRISFDAPSGVSELFAQIQNVQGADLSHCSFDVKLMTLPGVPKHLDVTVKSFLVFLWDRTDFIAGSVAGDATVMPINLPRSVPCGSLWRRDPSEDSTPQSGHYYSQLGFSSSTTRPALVVDDGGRIIVLALAPIVHTPLVDNAYIRRDISTDDLGRWKSIPENSIVCDTGDTRYGGASPAPTANLQPVDITALIECSENNSAYSRENPAVEVEDQLHRGTFFVPPVRLLTRSGNVLHMEIKVPPGAYNLGLRLPYVLGSLPCYSAMGFAVMAHTPRHLTFAICSCGIGGTAGGFLAVRLAAHSIRVGITMIPRNIRCGTEYPSGFAPGEDIRYATADGSNYYVEFAPYDPSEQPALVVDGPGIPRIFVSLPGNSSRAQGTESFRVVDVSVQTLSRWLDVSHQRVLICG